ncbi:hypothetical protein ACFLZP_03650 [Patescibacteria group bacterium]
MKKIVTHLNPDLDAISSIWLLKRFLPGWEKAEVGFVPAGRTWEDEAADSDPNVLHVDTGMGMLDHHQTSDLTCATALTWDYVRQKRRGQPQSPLEQEAIGRMVGVVTAVDNARDLGWAEVGEDRFSFYLNNIIYGLKRILIKDDELVEYVLVILDGLLRNLKDKVKAQEKINQEGVEFKTKWGKAVAVETGNEKVLWEAEVAGYVLVIKYDPDFLQRVKIYARFDSKVNLAKVYEEFKKIDPEADWFLHATKRLLLISSAPDARGTSLKLEQIIDSLKEEK